jgi:hypothetical protein
MFFDMINNQFNIHSKDIHVVVMIATPACNVISTKLSLNPIKNIENPSMELQITYFLKLLEDSFSGNQKLNLQEHIISWSIAVIL